MTRKNRPIPSPDVPIWDLPEDSEPKELRARTYRATGPVLPDTCKALAVQLQVDNPVDVYSDDRVKIGAANVFLNEFYEVWAELSFDYATPERLNTETGARPLYIFPVGSYQIKRSTLNRIWNHDRVPGFELVVEYLVLTSVRPGGTMDPIHVE